MPLTTSDQIEIDVRDDAAAMTHLFTLPAAARLDALAAMRGISTFDEEPLKQLKTGLKAAQAVVRPTAEILAGAGITPG
jgi:hypothetical protein